MTCFYIDVSKMILDMFICRFSIDSTNVVTPPENATMINVEIFKQYLKPISE